MAAAAGCPPFSGHFVGGPDPLAKASAATVNSVDSGRGDGGGSDDGGGGGGGGGACLGSTDRATPTARIGRSIKLDGLPTCGAENATRGVATHPNNNPWAEEDCALQLVKGPVPGFGSGSGGGAGGRDSGGGDSDGGGGCGGVGECSPLVDVWECMVRQTEGAYAG